MTDKKVALITGGSSGIGYATAEKFIREGYRVIISGRNMNKLDIASAKLGKHCDARQFDMAWCEKIPEFVREIKTKYDRIDVLVNNAGINQKKSFTDVTQEDFEKVIKVNQTGLFVMSREVAKVMLSQKTKGNIVNISSMTAHYGLPKVISYSASKTALEGMTRAMAVELSPKGVRVNAVAPGFISTAMTKKAFDNDPERKNRVISRTPMGIMGEPEDIANAIYFLASDQASFITGEVLKVDGGNSIGF